MIWSLISLSTAISKADKNISKKQCIKSKYKLITVFIFFSDKMAQTQSKIANLSVLEWKKPHFFSSYSAD